MASAGERAPGVHEQFETVEQQNETYMVGMWAFLVTEIMFFGVLFLAYALYRWKYQPFFYAAHTELDIVKGATNTVVLLVSSLTMALAVHYAQIKNSARQLQMLGLTLACAVVFLIIKAFEYYAKYQDGKIPGPGFKWDNEGAPAPVAELFFSLYFAMTGLHAAHVIVGILIIGTLAVLVKRNHHSVRDFIPTELVGLYWHFVDLVWIFLFPLFYLIPK
jgi:cytochrome c oxidase subunit 3